ncbi:MAG: spore coat protein CotH, partial [Evtepia sp.]
MSTHKHVDLLCLVLCLVILAGAAVLMALYYPRAQTAGTETEPEYAAGLFDSSRVHTIDITMADWEGFLETCENEEYALCTVTIDGDTVQDIGIRAKGNTSLSSVKEY